MEVAHIEAVRRHAARCCVVVALATGASSVSAQTQPAGGSPLVSQPQSVGIKPENVRLNKYLHDLAGPGAFVGVIGGGVLDQLWHKPAAWGGDDSFGRRIGSRATQLAVQVSVRHGLAALMHRSTDYQPCECRGFGRRVEHALVETFTDRGPDGSRALSVPRLAGAYAGGFSRLAWDRDRNVGDAALGTTISLGVSAVFNIARELTGMAR